MGRFEKGIHTKWREREKTETLKAPLLTQREHGKNRTKNKKPIPLETLRTKMKYIQYAWLQFLCLVCGKLRCTHNDLAKKNVYLFTVSVRMVKVNFNFNFSSFVFPLRSFLSIYWSIIADCGRCLWMVFLIEFHVAFDCVISLNSKDVSLLYMLRSDWCTNTQAKRSLPLSFSMINDIKTRTSPQSISPSNEWQYSNNWNRCIHKLLFKCMDSFQCKYTFLFELHNWIAKMSPRAVYIITLHNDVRDNPLSNKGCHYIVRTEKFIEHNSIIKEWCQKYHCPMSQFISVAIVDPLEKQWKLDIVQKMRQKNSKWRKICKINRMLLLCLIKQTFLFVMPTWGVSSKFKGNYFCENWTVKANWTVFCCIIS